MNKETSPSESFDLLEETKRCFYEECYWIILIIVFLMSFSICHVVLLGLTGNIAFSLTLSILTSTILALIAKISIMNFINLELIKERCLNEYKTKI